VKSRSFGSGFLRLGRRICDAPITAYRSPPSRWIGAVYRLSIQSDNLGMLKCAIVHISKTSQYSLKNPITKFNIWPPWLYAR
jgi:hypothetical protein